MERFKKIYHQGTLDVIEIWVDTETGVNYITIKYINQEQLFLRKRLLFSFSGRKEKATVDAAWYCALKM